MSALDINTNTTQGIRQKLFFRIEHRLLPNSIEIVHPLALDELAFNLNFHDDLFHQYPSLGTNISVWKKKRILIMLNKNWAGLFQGYYF